MPDPRRLRATFGQPYRCRQMEVRLRRVGRAPRHPHRIRTYPGTITWRSRPNFTAFRRAMIKVAYTVGEFGRVFQRLSADAQRAALSETNLRPSFARGWLPPLGPTTKETHDER